MSLNTIRPNGIRRIKFAISISFAIRPLCSGRLCRVWLECPQISLFEFENGKTKRAANLLAARLNRELKAGCRNGWKIIGTSPLFAKHFIMENNVSYLRTNGIVIIFQYGERRFHWKSFRHIQPSLEPLDWVPTRYYLGWAQHVPCAILSFGCMRLPGYSSSSLQMLASYSKNSAYRTIANGALHLDEKKMNKLILFT